MSDKETLAVYAAQAEKYAEMVKNDAASKPLKTFLTELPAGAHVLDWGCGAGNASAAMVKQGFRVTATDASDAFAKLVKETTGIEVRIETFAELDAVDTYDAIWASFSLLHAPKSDMPAHLAAAHRALKPGGLMFLGLKTGTGEQRDAIGRFYAYYTDTEITNLLADAGFTVTHRSTGTEPGLDGKKCGPLSYCTPMPDLFAYTDGACSGNPGPGGWGVLLIAREGDAVVKERELCGGTKDTTNNRMELMAAIEALDALERASDITVITDSAYVKNGVTSWIHGWKRNGWKTSDKKPVKNAELWQRLDVAQKRHTVTWKWIKGHAGHEENERADELARRGMAPYKPKG